MVEPCRPTLINGCVVLMVASPPTLVHVVGMPLYGGDRLSHLRRNECCFSHGKKHSCCVDARATICFSFKGNRPTRPSLLAFARRAFTYSRGRLPCTVKQASSCVFASLWARCAGIGTPHSSKHPIVPPVVRWCPWMGGPPTPFPPVSWLVIGGNTPPHGSPGWISVSSCSPQPRLEDGALASVGATRAARIDDGTRNDGAAGDGPGLLGGRASGRRGRDHAGRLQLRHRCVMRRKGGPTRRKRDRRSDPIRQGGSGHKC